LSEFTFAPRSNCQSIESAVFITKNHRNPRFPFDTRAALGARQRAETRQVCDRGVARCDDQRQENRPRLRVRGGSAKRQSQYSGTDLATRGRFADALRLSLPPHPWTAVRRLSCANTCRAELSAVYIERSAETPNDGVASRVVL
jgi:hypothetical protein